ncbi:hypothetical protein GCM10011574_06590 [Microbispora bryophytorum]|uniref:Uncharacterized protein n=1 Tax=Microbispora bryophytorum TaxID=1460882 RepID=A0A8H9LE59_9ACTN|nr:hypothetical protein GCM10011574_06590 [Microbispora bryophytorum]
MTLKPQREADATITLPDGTRRFATFMTLGVVSRVMERWQDTGECLNGRYFWTSDLVISREAASPRWSTPRET